MPPLALLLAPALLLAACAPEPEPVAPEPPADVVTVPDAAAEPEPVLPPADRVRAAIAPVGDGASGTVTLTRVDGGTRVLAELRGLSRSGFHGLQILAARTCDAPDTAHLGASAAPHGGPYAPPGLRHAGDLGNVRGDGGAGRYDRVDAVLALDGPDSAVGRAVVVRAGRDDGASADGAAGVVIGCGVLEVPS